MTYGEIQASAAYIRQCYPQPVKVACVLGSGLGELADTILQNPVKIPYVDIPHFPQSTVVGHKGALCLGEVRPGLHVAIQQGRLHAYEGHALHQVVHPLRTLKLLGAETLVVTNAAGGINTQFKPGDLMLIQDHINLTGMNPLLGPNILELGPRFFDMSQAYTPALQALALKTAQDLSIPLQQGVYVGLSGPNYETPAEIKMLRILGGDAVGMSTVPEVIAAAHMAMQVLGVSCITNAAAGVLSGHTLSHEEVLETTERAKIQFANLIRHILQSLT